MSHFHRNAYTFYSSMIFLSPAHLPLFRLLTFQENGVAAKLDNFMRQCLREFPHTHSSLLQQMVATLAKVSPVRRLCAHYTKMRFIKVLDSFIPKPLVQLFNPLYLTTSDGKLGETPEMSLHGSVLSEKPSSSLASTKIKEFTITCDH